MSSRTSLALIASAQRCGFWVYRVQSFLVSWFQSFLASWFQHFKDSLIPYYQLSVSCYQEDTDPIFKIPKKQTTDLHDVSAPVFSNISTNEIRHLDMYNIICFEIVWFCSCIRLRILVSPKIKMNGVGAQGHVKKKTKS